MAVRRVALLWIATLAGALAMATLPLAVFAATSAVTIQNSAFSPASITVKVGDTVTWTNRDGFNHTSTSDNAGGWDTGVIAAGTAHSIVFNSAGTFAYHCSIHLFMQGTVIVQGPATPPPTAPPPPPPTPAPTPVRTALPTPAATAPPSPSAAPTSPSPTLSPSPTASPPSLGTTVAVASASASTAAAQRSPASPPDEGPGTAVVAGAAIAIVLLGAVATLLLRRH
jgi:plastocyanin